MKRLLNYMYINCIKKWSRRRKFNWII